MKKTKITNETAEWLEERRRCDAVKDITDEDELYAIAMQDPSQRVRLAATYRIKTSVRLKAIALKETDGFNQYQLLYEIDDADVNAHYAKSAAELRTREKAVKRITDQEFLSQIFAEADHHGDTEEYEWESLASEAFSRLSDTVLLRKIARDTTLHGIYRRTALETCGNAELYQELILDDCELVAGMAASRVTSQELLMKAAYEHASHDVRMRAMQQLDQAHLLQVADSHPDSVLRRHAIGRVKEMPDALTLQLAFKDEDPLIRTAALGHIKDRSVLFQAILHDPHHTPAMSAYWRLKKSLSDEEKWRILKEAVSRDPRFGVIHFCKSKDMLEFAAKKDPDETVRRRAQEQLDNKLYLTPDDL